ncbi:hypothetical protein Q7C36_011454 [Tachysurus vachellii]|uniref:Uncharacterized protein n=1 Tax=Tachysurus vachellii TaxID=175792 RepID=A0AA88MRP2_TACVA|nr:hypothetical protein Q7C36_011454 [Tachysurus vachellii]
MGISGSRGKKVTPASVTEGDPRSQMLKCQTSSVSVFRKNTHKDRLSNKQVTQFSVDDSNLAEDVDRKSAFQKSPLYLCENYTFCYNQIHQHDTDTESTHTVDNIVPTDLLKPGTFEDKWDTCAFNKLSKPQKQTAVTPQRADPLCTKRPHVPGICDDMFLALPVAYDATEEDLMSAIEREFG